jgi:hypothetical protein
MSNTTTEETQSFADSAITTTFYSEKSSDSMISTSTASQYTTELPVSTSAAIESSVIITSDALDSTTPVSGLDSTTESVGFMLIFLIFYIL